MSAALILIDIDNTILFGEKPTDVSCTIWYGKGSYRFVSAHNIQLIRKMMARPNTILALMTGRRFSNYEPVSRTVPHHFAILEHGGEIVYGSVGGDSLRRVFAKIASVPTVDHPLWQFQNHLGSMGFRTERLDRKCSFRVMPSEEGSQPKNLAEVVRSAIEGTSFASYVVVVQNESFVDVIPSWSGKLSAARRIVDALEWPSFATFAAGDGHNDLEVLEWADWSYCATNAVPEVQSIVRFKGGFVSPQEGHLGASDVLEKLNGDVAQLLLGHNDASL